MDENVSASKTLPNEKIIIPLIWIVTFQYFYLIIQPTFIFIIYLYQYFAR